MSVGRLHGMSDPHSRDGARWEGRGFGEERKWVVSVSSSKVSFFFFLSLLWSRLSMS